MSERPTAFEAALLEEVRAIRRLLEQRAPEAGGVNRLHDAEVLAELLPLIHAAWGECHWSVADLWDDPPVRGKAMPLRKALQKHKRRPLGMLLSRAVGRQVGGLIIRKAKRDAIAGNLWAVVDATRENL